MVAHRRAWAAAAGGSARRASCAASPPGSCARARWTRAAGGGTKPRDAPAPALRAGRGASVCELCTAAGMRCRSWMRRRRTALDALTGCTGRVSRAAAGTRRRGWTRRRSWTRRRAVRPGGTGARCAGARCRVGCAAWTAIGGAVCHCGVRLLRGIPRSRTRCVSGCDTSECTPSKRSASVRRNSGSGAGLSGRDDVYSMSGRGVLYATPIALSAAPSAAATAMIPSAPRGEVNA